MVLKAASDARRKDGMDSTLDRELTELLEGRGQARYDLEETSQLAHALQTAELAERQGETPAMMLAALLHDVGHLILAMGENPAVEGRNDHHEALGAKWLAKRFAASVSEPVRLHVAAKRYLCAIEPGYAASLAPDSVLSLTLQGGPPTDEETAAFRDLPFADDAVRLPSSTMRPRTRMP